MRILRISASDFNFVFGLDQHGSGVTLAKVEVTYH